MKTETMSRILLTVFDGVVLALAFVFFSDEMRRLGWLAVLAALVILVAIWVPWGKWLHRNDPQPTKPAHPQNAGQKPAKKDNHTQRKNAEAKKNKH